MTYRILCWFALAFMGLGATAATAIEPNWGDWAEAARKSHPLAGDYYAVSPLGGGPGRGRYPPSHQGPALRREPGQQPYIVLLGEVHDNPAHHQLRAWLIANTAKMFPDWHPAVVFEQIGTDRQPQLNTFNARVQAGDATATVEELLSVIAWDKSGWPPAEIYKPLFAAVIAAKLPIYAGDPPRDVLRGVAKGDMSALAPQERTRLGLDNDMPPPLRESLAADLAESHCGALPPESADGLVTAQRFHDARLADAVLSAAQTHGSAILIAGNGHVRSDRGVPWYLRERAPKAKVASIMLLEVEAGKTDPALYVPYDPHGEAAVDAIIFTPKVDRGDPCQSLVTNKR